MNPDGSLDPLVMGILGVFCLPLIIKICSWVYDIIECDLIMADNRKRDKEAEALKIERAKDLKKWMIKRANEDTEWKAQGLPTHAERRREARLERDDAVARSEGKPTRAERIDFAKAMEKIATRGVEGRTVGVRCEGCGAPLSVLDDPCDYCGIITVFV